MSLTFFLVIYWQSAHRFGCHCNIKNLDIIHNVTCHWSATDQGRDMLSGLWHSYPPLKDASSLLKLYGAKWHRLLQKHVINTHYTVLSWFSALLWAFFSFSCRSHYLLTFKDNSPNPCLWLWEEAGVTSKNPRSYRKNMLTSHRNAPGPQVAQ